MRELYREQDDEKQERRSQHGDADPGLGVGVAHGGSRLHAGLVVGGIGLDRQLIGGGADRHRPLEQVVELCDEARPVARERVHFGRERADGLEDLPRSGAPLRDVVVAELALVEDLAAAVEDVVAQGDLGERAVFGCSRARRIASMNWPASVFARKVAQSAFSRTLSPIWRLRSLRPTNIIATATNAAAPMVARKSTG